MNRSSMRTAYLLTLAMVCGCAGQRDSRVADAAKAGAVGGNADGAAVRLDGVHMPISLPAPKGSNRVLTAHVTGGTARAVWMAVGDAPSSRLPLVPVGDGAYEINLYGQAVFDVLKQVPGGEFGVFAEMKDGTIAGSIPVTYHLDLPPATLDIGASKVTMTVHQRSSGDLPGSDGRLHLALGDITAGRVLVTVTGTTLPNAVNTKSMRVGDTFLVPLEKARYVLVLDEMVNLLMGRDHAKFTIMPESVWETERVEQLLGMIASSDVLFIRAGNEMTGAQFADWLRLKRGKVTSDVTTLDAFIEKVASRSRTTGEPYKVKLPSGEIVEAEAWLRKAAANARARKDHDKKGIEGSSTSAPSDEGL